MAEGVVTQIEKAPKQFFKSPIMALTIGLIAVVFVVLVEIFKPGAITGPIRRGLGLIPGLKGK